MPPQAKLDRLNTLAQKQNEGRLSPGSHITTHAQSPKPKSQSPTLHAPRSMFTFSSYSHDKLR